MPKSTDKTKNLKPNQITELLNDSDSGDDVLGAPDGDSDEEVEDIRGFTEDVGDEDVRFYNCDPPETTPGSEVLSWLASAPSRRVNPPTPHPPPALNGSWIFFCCSSSAFCFFHA